MELVLPSHSHSSWGGRAGLRGAGSCSRSYSSSGIKSTQMPSSELPHKASAAFGEHSFSCKQVLNSLSVWPVLQDSKQHNLCSREAAQGGLLLQCQGPPYTDPKKVHQESHLEASERWNLRGKRSSCSPNKYLPPGRPQLQLQGGRIHYYT